MRVALIGNPNTGKTTIFNQLTGFRARVGNYAGVTVERKSGPLKDSAKPVEVIDLPGTYSLAARSADEMIAVDVLLGHRSDEPRPDAVLIVADASNLERNLFLASQVLECHGRCALVLNMVDVAEAAGVTVDARLLAERLGVPVFPVVASKGTGLAAVREYLQSAEPAATASLGEILPEAVAAEAAALRGGLLAAGVPAAHAEEFLVRRALLEASGIAEARIAEAGGNAASKLVAESKLRLSAKGINLVTLEAKARYGMLRKRLEGVIARREKTGPSASDRIDAVLIHRLWGTAIFAVLMMVVFQSIYTWSGPAMDAIDGLFAAIGEWAGTQMAEGPLKSLVVDGIIAGVGGVVIFLPQILILFFFISILEDCGYMARAAFLMDRLLSRIGLSGRSFIPMLSSFACAIPGIMATRTIEDRRDRLTTILVAPLMSCSARLPVYALMIGMFVPDTKVLGVLNLQGVTLFAMYLVGIGVSIPVALVLKRTVLKGPAPAFIMELPPYRAPQWKMVAHRLLERAGAFLKRAGTVIFAISVVIWAMTYYPRPAGIAEKIEAEYAPRIAAAEGGAAAEIEAERDNAIAGAYLRQSVLGRMGHAIEPLVKPLGWDWRIGMATIASFPAREVVISTMGVIFNVGSDADEESEPLRERLAGATWEDGTPLFNLPVALGIMVFFALCMQCAATLAIIRRETNSWRWPLFAFGYMTLLAYIGAFIAYRGAMALL